MFLSGCVGAVQLYGSETCWDNTPSRHGLALAVRVSCVQKGREFVWVRWQHAVCAACPRVCNCNPVGSCHVTLESRRQNMPPAARQLNQHHQSNPKPNRSFSLSPSCHSTKECAYIPLAGKSAQSATKTGCRSKATAPTASSTSTPHPTGETTLHQRQHPTSTTPGQISRTQLSAINPHNFLSESHTRSKGTHRLQVAAAHKLKHSCSGVRHSTHAEANRQHHNDPSSACTGATSRTGTLHNGSACWVLLAAANPWVGKCPQLRLLAT